MLIDFPLFDDQRGRLVPFEFDHKMPFVVRRSYLVECLPGVMRGGHAHRIEDEVFVAITGKIIATIDDGSGKKDFALDKPNKGLVVRRKQWHEFMAVNEPALMLCFSSVHYTPGEDNYITDYQAFQDKFGQQ